MPTRRHFNPNIDAAIERRLNKLRQLPARLEAERFIARKFAEAGRPLRPDVGFEERVGNKPFSSNADEPERQPPQGNRSGRSDCRSRFNNCLGHIRVTASVSLELSGMAVGTKNCSPIIARRSFKTPPENPKRLKQHTHGEHDGVGAGLNFILLGIDLEHFHVHAEF